MQRHTVPKEPVSSARALGDLWVLLTLYSTVQILTNKYLIKASMTHSGAQPLGLRRSVANLIQHDLQEAKGL